MLFVVEIMAGLGKCFKCASDCVFKEDKVKLFGFPCDLCSRVICQECNKIMAQEIRVIPSGSRSLVHLCPECLVEFRQLPKFLKQIPNIQQELNECMSKLNKLDMQVSSPENSEIMAKVKKLESHLKKLCDKVDNAPKPILQLPVIENIEQQLKNQSSDISRKLDSVVEAIKDTNNELIHMLFTPNNNNNISSVASAKQSEASKAAQNFSVPANFTTNGVHLNPPESVYCSGRDPNSNNVQRSIPHGLGLSAGSTLQDGNRIRGSKNGDAGGLVAAEKREWFHLSNLKGNTTAEQITAYLKGHNIATYDCEKINVNNSHSASFKLSISPNNKLQILDSALWPTDVIVKPFIFNRGNGGYKGPAFFRRKPRQAKP